MDPQAHTIHGTVTVTLRLAALLPLSLLISGCGDKVTRFEIANHRAVGDTEYFHEQFDECYYAIAPNGNVDLIARRHLPAVGEANEALTQIVHVRTVYRAIPGTTHVSSSMINGVVSYVILSSRGGACFEGAGFLLCEENRAKRSLTGELERATLHPSRRVGSVGSIFDRAVLRGEFFATRDERKVVAILNEIERVFGPLPPYVPPADRRDPI
jgi:hypothetical protein